MRLCLEELSSIRGPFINPYIVGHWSIDIAKFLSQQEHLDLLLNSRPPLGLIAHGLAVLEDLLESAFWYIFHFALPKIHRVVAVHFHVFDNSSASKISGVNVAGIDLRSDVDGHHLMASDMGLSVCLA
jgi:hypothetical protein